ncbi:DUF2155 domain-containing protein [Gemmobacter fulvus]|uniref:DUF2155 domain-containing protein n=1 Tax=Gemmobacter fulvus TaxID=2840474 RepID=A0A975P5U5_9RHOB|nr:DUF2155 domain-containing protein [Gemmobacter fulvus]MBT9245487.1 DUF2155 domain-containing protein [Gemmobacter fulvus]QWK90210.1 DUF2155 domain-containing protein [Gemmobacter fulvus]
MKRLLVAALLTVASPAAAEDVTDSPGAILRWLDKMTGETADIELSRGQAAVSGRLTIQLDECRYPSANPASNAYAHLTIMEKGKADPAFTGWMVASSPALSALEHPRYDVWVLRCLTPGAPQIEDMPEPEEGEEIIAPQEG